MLLRPAPRLALIALSAIALVRCAVTDYEPAPLAAFDTPRRIDHQREEREELDEDETAEAEEAPKPAVVDLNEAIAEALGSSSAIAALSEKVEQTRGELITASLIPNPIFYMSTSLQPFPGLHITPLKQAGPPQYDILLQQQIDPLLFGKRSAATEAAKRGVDVARADYADARRQRALATAAAFYDVLVAKELVRLTNEAVDQLERVEKLIGGRVASGDTAIIDLDRARLNTRVTRRESRQAFVGLAQARAQLQSLMGRRHEDPAFDIRGELETSDSPEVPSVEDAMARAETLRPDIESARREVQRAEAALKSAKREALPEISVTGGMTYQHQHPIGYNDAHLFGGGFTVSLPTFDRNQGNIAIAESKLRQARLLLDALLVSTRAEVDRIISEYGQERDSMRIDSAETVEAARDVRNRIRRATARAAAPFSSCSMPSVLTRRPFAGAWRSCRASGMHAWRSTRRSATISPTEPRAMTPQAEVGRSRRWFAWSAMVATGIVLAFVVMPRRLHQSDGVSAKPASSAADAVKIVGKDAIVIDPNSAIAAKLNFIKVTDQLVSYPRLTVTGNILARRGTARGKDAWQFASSDIAAAYADYLKADAEVELSERERANVVSLTALQTKRAEDFRARVQRLVETGTEATRELVNAEAQAAQTKLEGERAVFEATSNVSVATRAREAAQQQLVQNGLEPEVLAAAAAGSAILAAEVPEARMGVAKEHDPCTAKFYGIPDVIFSGEVTRLAPVVSRERRTLGVLVALADPGERLKPGMFGEVALGTNERNAILIDADGVIHIGDKDYVFARRDSGPFHITAVQVGEPHEGRIEIIEGVAAGDEVIGSGAVLLKRHAVAALAGNSAP